MNFYTALSKYYDDIFPMNPTTLDFLINNLNTSDRVLDIACGSGEYSIGLAKRGISCSALDLDDSMISKANTKALKHRLNITFTAGNMLRLENYFPNASFGSAFCIGNSLVHLGSEDDILTALNSIHNILKVGGRLIIQIINYYRIKDMNTSSLPTIKNEDAGVEFIRSYIENGDKITFRTTLNTKDEGTLENRIDLIPLCYDTLISFMEKIGFQILAAYGSFKGDAFEKDKSLPFIVVASKK